LVSRENSLTLFLSLSIPFAFALSLARSLCDRYVKYLSDTFTLVTFHAQHARLKCFSSHTHQHSESHSNTHRYIYTHTHSCCASWPCLNIVFKIQLQYFGSVCSVVRVVLYLCVQAIVTIREMKIESAH